MYKFDIYKNIEDYLLGYKQFKFALDKEMETMSDRDRVKYLGNLNLTKFITNINKFYINNFFIFFIFLFYLFILISRIILYTF